MSSISLLVAENILLELGAKAASPTTIFLLGAPRTGSTYLYQVMANKFRLPFISNLTNENFPDKPILGLAIQHGIQENISDQSKFGKTNGAFQPSEASGPMSYWFGGGHPSQTVSTHIKEGMGDHFLSTLLSGEALYGGKSLLIKNAWNCFRIPYLASALPLARFIWIRRDIRDAAASDLEARYLTKGTPYEWNSATPSNLEELRTLRPEHQVVENQFEYNQAIQKSVSLHAPGRWLDVWFEDFVEDPTTQFDRLSNFLEIDLTEPPPPPRQRPSRNRNLYAEEIEIIRDYVKSDDRFNPYCYKEKQ